MTSDGLPQSLPWRRWTLLWSVPIGMSNCLAMSQYDSPCWIMLIASASFSDCTQQKWFCDGHKNFCDDHKNILWIFTYKNILLQLQNNFVSTILWLSQKKFVTITKLFCDYLLTKCSVTVTKLFRKRCSVTVTKHFVTVTKCFCKSHKTYLWSPYVIGRPYIFSCCFFLSSFFFLFLA